MKIHQFPVAKGIINNSIVMPSTNSQMVNVEWDPGQGGFSWQDVNRGVMLEGT